MKFAAIAPPRLRTAEESERTATWLELFYDLVFVAAVAMMGTRLVSDVSWAGVASYLAYFALVWWLWASHTFYADRYDTDDLIYRLLAGAQMVAVAVIAVSLSLGEAGSTQVFALGYTATRFTLLLLYARAYRHVPGTRALVRGYLIGFGTASAIWLVSIATPEPARFWLWGVAFAVDLATPYAVRKIQAASPLDRSHLPERFGLFTILVLGESIVAVTVGLSHVAWQTPTTIVGILGLGAATCLWWINFEHLDGSVIRRRGEGKNWRPTVWIYSHLPLAAALAMFGVSVELAIIGADHGHEYSSNDRWLLAASVALAYAAMAGIQIASVRAGQEHLRASAIRARLAGIPLVLIIGLIPGLGAVWTMALVTAVCTAEVLVDLFAANPEFISALSASLRVEDDS
ncbi:MAG: low temperature requirement protein A [Acidimicrobiia bacterium]